jgi:N-methylhydantoinase B
MDAVTMSVLGHAMNAIAKEMGVNLYQAAHSTIVREIRDIGTALFDAEGYTVAMANWIPMLSNALEPALQAVKGHYDLRDIEPHEAFLTNDPFDGGQHVNDILLFTPIHHLGRVIGFSCANVHHLDVGGGAPASNARATEVFQEGIVFPPMKVDLSGDWTQSVFGKVFSRNIRAPHKTIPDFDAQIAACRTGQRRVGALIAKYGIDVVETFMTEVQRYSERIARAAIREIPDGDYVGSSYMEGDGTGRPGPHMIRATVRVRGDGMVIDFSGSDAQVPGFINVPLASTFSTVRTTTMSILGVDIRFVNAGAFRPIGVEAPLGSILNPTWPAATRARTSTCYKIFDAVNYALAPVLPKKVTAPGFDSQTGASFAHRGASGMSIFSEALGAGNGGLLGQDGADGMIMHLTNAANTPVESVEIEHPFLEVAHYRLVQDSGGLGRYRGGMGIERTFRVLADDVNFGLHSDRHDHGADGLFGGGPGAPGFCGVERNGVVEVLGSKVHVTLGQGDLLTVRTGGGAGYGPVEERDTAAILRDLREGRISEERAMAPEGYGLADRLANPGD